MEQDKINPSYYAEQAISPIEYIVANKMGFIEGNIIKYVSRYKEKNGVEDLKKARWYINSLIDLMEGIDNGGVTRETFADYVRKWISAINTKISFRKEEE